MKRKILAVCSLFLCMAIGCAGNGSSTIYVSSSAGDDANDGHSPRNAVRTITHAVELGSDIRLKSGDWFFERVTAEGIRISPYGPSRNGRPVLSGFRIVPAGMKDADGRSVWERGSFSPSGKWSSDENGSIYRIDLIGNEGFGGYTDNSSASIANIGTLYDPKTDTMYGRKCQAQTVEVYDTLDFKTGTSYRYPVKDMDFYQALGTEEPYRYVYVMASDPSMLRDRELWMSVGATGIAGAQKDIRGVKVLGWGAHGAATSFNVSISDCEFDIIGGAFLNGYPYWVRYGNGVEFWAKKAFHSEVSGCRFSRVYDTGTTIQGPMDKSCICDSIIFHNNYFKDCRQDFEVWINSSDGVMPTRCAFVDNTGYDSGNNGFESEEFNNTHLLHYVKKPYSITGINIDRNEFCGGEGLYYSVDLKDMPLASNTYHCAPGAPVLKTAGGLIIPAPVEENGRFRYASTLDENGSISWGYARTMEEALSGLGRLLKEMTGSDGLKIVINQR